MASLWHYESPTVVNYPGKPAGVGVGSPCGAYYESEAGFLWPAGVRHPTRRRATDCGIGISVMLRGRTGADLGGDQKSTR